MIIKQTFLTILLVICVLIGRPQDVKNVILMIPDGASSDLLSLARWYSGSNQLAIDELICGMVKTHSADSTIADSAPSGTAMATGYKSITKYIGIDRDRIPQLSILELAKLSGMATGVVVNSQFPHATPAAFIGHHANRNDYHILSKQFVYNSPSLVFSGGKKYIDENDLEPLLSNQDIKLITNAQEFRALKDFSKDQKAIWSLFNDWNSNTKYLSYNCDRNDDEEPSLAEMTEKAIELLSKNENGFFLMVEGSQIDWAAHVNDPKAIVTEFLAFDKSVEVALKYAKLNGETAVIVCPDHGNGGISIGNMQSDFQSSNPNKYDKLNVYTRIVEPLRAVNRSSRWVVESLLNELDSNQGVLNLKEMDSLIAKNYSVYLTDNEFHSLMNSLKWFKSNKTNDSQAADDTLSKAQVLLGQKLSREIFIGWTTTGHTSEDVFLGIYHPNNDRLTGVIDNTEVASYIKRLLSLNELLHSNKEYFIPIMPSDSFKNWEKISANPLIFKNKNSTLEIPFNTNHYIINGKKHYQSTLTIAIDEKVYISSEVMKLLKNP